MSPIVQQILLGLWLVVGSIVAIVLTVAAGWRTGFHIRAQVNRETGMKEDSTLLWFAIIGGLFMAPPALLLGASIASDLLYEVTRTVAGFWWVGPAGLAAFLLFLVGWYFLGRKHAEAGEAPPRPAEQAPAVTQASGDTWVQTPLTYGSQPYGQYGDGGL